MSFSTTVTFHGFEASDALRQHAVELAARLEKFASDIIACDVVIESRNQRRHQGNRYGVRIQLSLRGRKLQVGPGPVMKGRYEDPYVAVTDAFDALRRRVEDHVRKRRGDVKTHTRPPD